MSLKLQLKDTATLKHGQLWTLPAARTHDVDDFHKSVRLVRHDLLPSRFRFHKNRSSTTCKLRRILFIESVSTTRQLNGSGVTIGSLVTALCSNAVEAIT